MKEIKIAVSDIDGTLVNSQKEITPVTVDAVNRLMENGVIFAIATGRNFHELGSIYTAFSKKIPVIALNGGYIADEKGKTISSNPFDGETLKYLRAVLDKGNYYYELMDQDYVYSHSEKLRFKILSARFHFTMESKRAKQTDTYKQTVFINYDEIEDYTKEIQKICVFDHDSRGLSELKRHFENYTDCEISSSHPENIEINAKGVTKGTGIKTLAAHYGLTAETVLAIGDNLNDVSMLETAGIFCAMKNSHPFILEHSRYFTDSNDENGVAKAFRQFGLA